MRGCPGWHTTKTLKLPSNLTILPFPRACLELNPAETPWRFLRQTYLSARVLETYADFPDSVVDAWHKLTTEVDRITSTTAQSAVIGCFILATLGAA
jgi:hypothetical protein